MKVYIVADLEGVSGVGGFDVLGDELPGKVEKRKRWIELWMQEVNAAVQGCLEAGAREVLVLDNHGPGDSLPLGSLAPPARLIHGLQRPTWLPLLDGSVDALVFVGQHARVGSAGHLCHTYSRTRLRRVQLNDREIGEIGLVAGIAGTHGVPVVFLSGDQVAAEEAREWVPGMGTVAVKQGLSLRTCASLPCGEARELIREEVAQSLMTRDQVAPLALEPPFTLTVDYPFKDGWRPLARVLLGRGSGLRLAGLMRLRLSDDCLPRLWDRFIGLG